MPLYYSQKFTADIGQHRFPMERYKSVYQNWLALQQRTTSRPGNATRAKITVPPQACLKDVLRVHDAHFVQAYVKGKLDKKANQAIGFPWSKEFVERTLCITGVHKPRMIS
jgi:acetoin utilization deacetylase AcuC-like enzyme